MATTKLRAASEAQPHEVLKHIPALDGVRGLAVCLVLGCHLLLANQETPSHLVNILVKTVFAGWVGVDIFFVLSGFLITGILVDSMNGGSYFKNFYGRRALRIFPLYYGVIIVLFLIFPAGLKTELRSLSYLLLFLQNTPLFFHHLSGAPPVGLTTQMWSLAAEEQFYLVWPLVVFLVRDRRVLTWVAAAGIVAAPLIRTALYARGVSPSLIYCMTICRADTLLSGAWLALMVRGKYRDAVLSVAPGLFWTAVAICLYIAWSAGYFNGNAVSLIHYGYTVLALGAMGLLAMTLRAGSRCEALMNAGWLRFMGRYSYGLYMFHVPVLALLEMSILPVMHDHVHSLVVYHALVAAAALAVTIPLAMLSFRFYEMPFLRLKRFLDYKPRAAGSGGLTRLRAAGTRGETIS